MSEPTVDWLGTGEAAARLGVKPSTLYAYVSRGVLLRRRGDDGQSLFDAAEVERLARRGRPRHAPAPAEVIIESEVTALGDGRPFYRGRDALELAAKLPFESVAAWLWAANPAALRCETVFGPWQADPEARAAGLAAQAGLPDDVSPLERFQVVVPALATTDPRRLTFDENAVIAVGQSVIAGMVGCLPIPDAAVPSEVDYATGTIDPSAASSMAGKADPGAASRLAGTADPGATIASQLYARLTPGPADPGLVDALRAALILVADNELAASTLAARVAASVRADPYAVVTTGLGAIGGPLHGGASLGAEAMLAEVRDPDLAHHALGLRLRHGERIPGLGNTVYRGEDRRATYLLDRIRAAVPGNDRLVAAEAVLAEARRRRLPGPNVEYALATLAHVAGMISGAGEAIFAVGRAAGWLAHALEEYAQPTQLRLRAAYVGPPVERTSVSL